MQIQEEFLKPKPLNITCSSAKCESALHCFRPTREMKKKGESGRCRKCGVQLVDWTRMHAKRIEDAQFVFKMLKFEYFRHHMWHVTIDEKAVRYADRKGVVGLRAATENRLNKHISNARPPWDGRQTPLSGNPIYYAQHATASCCRKCMEYWYGIPPARQLTPEEIAFFTELIMLYLKERLPETPI